LARNKEFMTPIKEGGHVGVAMRGGPLALNQLKK